jgi:hypothetical protein
MTKQDEIIELAIQGHASTRDAIRWAMNQEKERIAEACERLPFGDTAQSFAIWIREQA